MNWFTGLSAWWTRVAPRNLRNHTPPKAGSKASRDHTLRTCSYVRVRGPRRAEFPRPMIQGQNRAKTHAPITPPKCTSTEPTLHVMLFYCIVVSFRVVLLSKLGETREKSCANGCFQNNRKKFKPTDCTTNKHRVEIVDLLHMVGGSLGKSGPLHSQAGEGFQ